ncbi:hypothetical protein F5879DRAFT_938669, partial [Lentinula edodes]
NDILPLSSSLCSTSLSTRLSSDTLSYSLAPLYLHHSYLLFVSLLVARTLQFTLTHVFLSHSHISCTLYLSYSLFLEHYSYSYAVHQQ